MMTGQAAVVEAIATATPDSLAATWSPSDPAATEAVVVTEVEEEAVVLVLGAVRMVGITAAAVVVAVGTMT